MAWVPPTVVVDTPVPSVNAPVPSVKKNGRPSTPAGSAAVGSDATTLNGSSARNGVVILRSFCAWEHSRVKPPSKQSMNEWRDTTVVPTDRTNVEQNPAAAAAVKV